MTRVEFGTGLVTHGRAFRVCLSADGDHEALPPCDEWPPFEADNAEHAAGRAFVAMLNTKRPTSTTSAVAFVAAAPEDLEGGHRLVLSFRCWWTPQETVEAAGRPAGGTS